MRSILTNLSFLFQIITLTLANNFNQSQEILVNSKRDEATSSGSSSPSSISRDLSASSGLPTTGTNIKATSSLSSSFDSNSLSSSDGLLSSSVGSLNSSATSTPVSSCGLNVDVTHRNVTQYLSQQSSVINLDGENSSFKSPNVIAPKSEDPLPFIHSSNSAPYSPLLSSTPSTTSQIPLSATTIASSTAGNLSCNNINSNLSSVNLPKLGKNIISSTTRPVQTNVAPFPFASMQYAMQTAKQGSSLSANVAANVQSPIKINPTQPNRLPLVNISTSHGVLSPKITQSTSPQSQPSTSISPLQPLTISSTVPTISNSDSTTPPPNLVVPSTPPPLSPSTFIRNPNSYPNIRGSTQQVIFNVSINQKNEF